MVLICLIFSVLSTIEQYSSFANETLFWMVSRTLINSRNLSEKWVLNLTLLDLRTLHWAGCIKCCHLHLRWRHLYQNRLFRVPSHSGNQGKPWKGVSNFPVRENSGNLVKTQKNQGKLREFVIVTQKGKVFASLVGLWVLCHASQVVSID